MNTKKIIEVNGYLYPNIDRAVFRSTLPYLTYMSIFSYRVTPEGDLVMIQDEELIQIAKGYLVAPMMVITNIDATGKFSSTLARMVLQDEVIQKKLLDNILKIAKDQGYYGVDIDFEYIYPEDKDLYNNFLARMVTLFHENDLIVTTALAPKVRGNQVGILYEAHDYDFHGQTVDHVILMTYEWGYTYGPPQAVAPLDQVKRVLDYAVTVIPRQKILLGIPNYGYDWTLPYQEGRRAKSISHQEAIDLATAKKSTIQFDEVARSPYFYYTDEQGNAHVVWFENEKSLKEKLALVDEYQLSGASFWTINNLYPTIFSTIDQGFYVQKVL